MEDDSVSPIKCAKCGRLLTLARSVERELGPVCFKKVQEYAVAAAIREDQPILLPSRAF